MSYYLNLEQSTSVEASAPRINETGESVDLERTADGDRS